MIHLLPGMGADGRMFPDAWRTLENSSIIEWPTYDGERSIAALAKRVLAEHSIQAEDTIVGCSLGGMVACEIAKMKPVSSLVLIGSAITKNEISSLLSILHPLIDFTPLTFLQRCAAKLPADAAQMFSASDPGFIRAMCCAIFEWDGLTEVPSNLVRIHGRRDLVIPVPSGIQHILDGGHLISMTHSQDCVRIIRNEIITR
jgi:pimeloyl-ACP methyl ester carboxylesterase